MEQAEDDVAPATFKYVPAKARDDEKVRLSRFEDKRLRDVTKREGEKVGGEHTFDSRSGGVISCLDLAW